MKTNFFFWNLLDGPSRTGSDNDHSRRLKITICNICLINLTESVLSQSQEYNWNIEWTEELVRNHHHDREIPVLSHNDAHAGNMMMNKTDFTGESLILIDWDITHYGYRDVFASSRLWSPKEVW